MSAQALSQTESWALDLISYSVRSPKFPDIWNCALLGIPVEEQNESELN